MIQLCFGNGITDPAGDKLTEINYVELFQKVTDVSSVLVCKTNQLRRLGGIDTKGYQNMKKSLPYFTCGLFNPPFRKTENFTSICCFVLDLDHLSDKATSPEVLKPELMKDPRIAMMFTSPGGDGLKLLFVLKEPFTDHGKYTLFYKLFSASFSKLYNLNQVVDKRTSDVCRATFICHDPDAYSNPLYEAVDPAKYIDFDSAVQLDEAHDYLKELESDNEIPFEVKSDETDDIAHEILLKIKTKLNPKYKPRPKEKSYYVPEEVNLLEENIRKRCEEVDLVIESHPIQYGKQLEFTAGFLKAELNIFFGRQASRWLSQQRPDVLMNLMI